MTGQPTVGRVVHYTMSQFDADAVNKRRADFQQFRSLHSGPSDPGQAGADGHVAHVGNHVPAGLVCAAIVVRSFGGDAVNLQVLMDGNDTFWATSRTEGDGEGHWSWPVRT